MAFLPYNTSRTPRLIKPVALLHGYQGMVNVQDCAGPRLNVPYEGSTCQTAPSLVPALHISTCQKGAEQSRKLGAFHPAGWHEPSDLSVPPHPNLGSATALIENTGQGARIFNVLFLLALDENKSLPTGLPSFVRTPKRIRFFFLWHTYPETSGTV